MENQNIVMLKHHPMGVKFTNTFYVNQCSDLAERTIIDVTSRVTRDRAFMAEHPNFAKEVSPFFIGSVTGPDGATSHVFEHFWQCGKVYPCHYRNGEIPPEYFTWRKKWYDKTEISQNKAESRHPNTELCYFPGDCLFFAYYENGSYQHLNYVEARKKVYAPYYAKLIHNTESFKWMKKLVDEGKKIALVDFDGFNYYSPKAMGKLYESYINKCKKKGLTPNRELSDYLNIKTMRDAINCSFLQVGHGFVIKMLLQGDLSINPDGSLNDPQGLLK